jgi:hypothetical protein
MYADFMETIQERLASECQQPVGMVGMSIISYMWSAPSLKRQGVVHVYGWQERLYTKLQLELLDRMIKLTEIKEVVPVSRKSFLQTAAAGV